MASKPNVTGLVATTSSSWVHLKHKCQDFSGCSQVFAVKLPGLMLVMERGLEAAVVSSRRLTAAIESANVVGPFLAPGPMPGQTATATRRLVEANQIVLQCCALSLIKLRFIFELIHHSRVELCCFFALGSRVFDRPGLRTKDGDLLF